MKKFNVAVVGASGMVGGELLGLLESRRFPVGELYPFNSGKKPASVVFRGKKYACAAPSLEALKRSDIAFFVSTDEVAGEFAPRLARAGVWCIDDSSRFRLAAGVPLVIPEVNGAELGPGKKLIAGPNCTLTGAAVALAGIHRRFRVTELRLATYQAVSGAGKSAMGELEEELKGYFKKNSVVKPKGGKFPRPIAFNLFPQVGGFDADGNSGEENKVEAELKKIWGDRKIRISCTAVRVPVLRGHSLAAWFKETFEHFYLELMDHGLEEQKKVITMMLELGKKLEIPVVATQDVHYVEKEDAYFQDIVLCIGTKKKLADKDRLKFSSDQFYLKDADEMKLLFRELLRQ